MFVHVWSWLWEQRADLNQSTSEVSMVHSATEDLGPRLCKTSNKVSKSILRATGSQCQTSELNWQFNPLGFCDDTSRSGDIKTSQGFFLQISYELWTVLTRTNFVLDTLRNSNNFSVLAEWEASVSEIRKETPSSGRSSFFTLPRLVLLIICSSCAPICCSLNVHVIIALAGFFFK